MQTATVSGTFGARLRSAETPVLSLQDSKESSPAAPIPGTVSPAAIDHTEIQRLSRFFLHVGASLARGFGGELALAAEDRPGIQIFSIKKDDRDVLLVVDITTYEQYTYDVSKQAMIKLREEEKQDLSKAADITEEAFALREANGIPASASVQPTAKIVLVDSFQDLSGDAFYQSLILHFSPTLGEGSQVIFVSEEEGKAEEIAALAKKLGVKNSGQFVAMAKEGLADLNSPASYLVADTYLAPAKKLYGEDKKYFGLESPKERNLTGVYAFQPIGVLMDLVSLGDWAHAAQLYSQLVRKNVSADELQSALRGVLLIPFISKHIDRLVSQVYMAERAIGGAA